MGATVANAAAASHLLRREMPRPTMAKADLTNREKRAEYGRILRRASAIAGFNRQQTANELDVDEGQLGRWWSGAENPQTWRYHAHQALAPALLQAQAETVRGVRLRLTIELDRSTSEAPCVAGQ